jgi:hypothetical protein
MENLAYSFNCQLNLVDERSNLSFKKEANLLAGFYIDYKKSRAVIENEYKKKNR